MTLTPAVSVVIPARNASRWIDEQLAALSAQDFAGSWEVVVADNGSTDDTGARVRTWVARFPVSLRVVDAAGRPGVSHARNTGLLAARAPLVAFCDADDHAAPGWLSGAVRALNELDMVSGRIQLLTDPVTPTAPTLNAEVDLSRAVTGGNFATRRAVCLALGGFDEGLPAYGCEDFDLSVRAVRDGLRLGSTEAMVMYVRRTAGVRAALRKVYVAGLAEAVVWQRHPQFANRMHVRVLAAELARLPVAWVRAGEALGARSALRRAVSQLGTIVGLLRVRRGWCAEPMLLTPSDEL